MEKLGNKLKIKKKLGVLGGSFDPAHKGHLAISKEAIKKFKLKKVIWAITKKNPLKKVSPSSFDDRVEKTKKLVKSPNIKLSPIEIRQNFNYSFQLLNFIQKRHRHIKFIWVMGEDNIIQFHLWKNWQWIANNVRIAVVARGRSRSLVNSSTFAFKYRSFRLMSGQSAQLQHYKPPIWCIVDSKRLNLSSSDLRSNV